MWLPGPGADALKEYLSGTSLPPVSLLQSVTVAQRVRVNSLSVKVSNKYKWKENIDQCSLHIHGCLDFSEEERKIMSALVAIFFFFKSLAFFFPSNKLSTVHRQNGLRFTTFERLFFILMVKAGFCNTALEN